MSRQEIISRLQSLEELQGVSVDISAKTKGTVRITHEKHHAPEFLFRWSNNHFIGYFIDGSGAQSQAIVSLYNSIDAGMFVCAYIILNGIRSNQKGG